MSRSNGYQTKNRQQILNYLREHKDSIVTAAAIHKEMMRTENKVNITTIYRYLDKLVEEKIILKHVSEKGEKSGYQFIESGSNCHNHIHLQCIICGKIIHLDCEFMNEMKEHILDHHDFELQCDKSMLYGVCVQCRKKHIENVTTSA